MGMDMAKMIDMAEQESNGPVFVEADYEIERATTPMKKVMDKVCERCGSDDVKVDAWAVWDPYKQMYVLDEVFQQEFCPACDGETHSKELEKVVPA